VYEKRVSAMVKVKEVKAKGILNRSKIFDYCLNPYTGCQINCAYCYARLFMRRYSGHTEPWGEFVDVKVNAPQLLKRQLDKTKRGTVWISSVCDPYQPLEATYMLTRSCLKELAKKDFPVNIQTKSSLVVRDMDLFREFKSIEVGCTITTNDERVASLFEPGAAPVEERLRALETIHSSGVNTFAFVGPLLPGNPERLIASLEGKVDTVLIDRMNYVYSVRGFYHQLGLQGEMTDRFFHEYRERLISELEKRNMKFQALF
jgi:DNA repair photolyase